MLRNSYWITDYAQIEALAHPARHEIVDRLSALGPIGARGLAEAIGRKVTTIYHHLQLLERVGLIEVASIETADSGRPFAIYRTLARRMRLTRALKDKTLRRPLAKWAKVVGIEAARQYAKALDEEDFSFNGPSRNMWLYRVVCSPSPKRLARINELLEELAELVWTPDPKPGPLITVAWFVSPLGRILRKPKSSKREASS